MSANFLQDNQGNSSSMRLVWTISTLVIVGVWAYCSIISGVMQSFSSGDALWIASLFAGKVGQKYVEGNSSKKSIKKPIKETVDEKVE